MLCRPATEIASANESASVRAVELRGEGPILMLPATEEGLIIPRGGAANAATIWTDKRKDDTKNMTTGRWSCSLESEKGGKARNLMCLDVQLASSAQEG